MNLSVFALKSNGVVILASQTSNDFFLFGFSYFHFHDLVGTGDWGNAGHVTGCENFFFSARTRSLTKRQGELWSLWCFFK